MTDTTDTDASPRTLQEDRDYWQARAHELEELLRAQPTAASAQATQEIPSQREMIRVEILRDCALVLELILRFTRRHQPIPVTAACIEDLVGAAREGR